MNEMWLIGLVGGGAGIAVGGPLLLQRPVEGERWTTDRLTGLWLVGGAIAMALVGLRHGGVFSPGWSLAIEHITNASSFVAWTVLVTLARRIGGLAPAWPSRVADHLVLPLAYALVIAAAGVPDIRFLWLLPVSLACVFAVGHAWHMVRASKSSAVIRQMNVLFVLTIAFCGAQAVRSFFPRVAELREIVPIVMTALFFAIGFALSGRSLTPARAAYRKSGLTPLRAAQVVHELDARMRDGGWYRETELTLSALASKLGVAPHIVSQALNQQRKQGLHEYLSDWRVRDAKAQLEDPANDCYSVEGIARQSGFASRSAFYRAFRDAEGVTPTDYRARVRASIGAGIRSSTPSE